MPETTEEKIAKSTDAGATAQYADQLEKEADDIIKQHYEKGNEDGSDNGSGEEPTSKEETSDDGGTDSEGTGDADEDTGEGDGTGESSDSTGDADSNEHSSDDADDDTDDTIESLREQLDKSQQQVKHNKGEFTKRSQDLAEANKRSEHLEQNVFDLKNQIAELKTQLEGKSSEKKEAKVVESTVNIADKLKQIKEVDPDIAKAITPVFEDLVNQVSSLQNEIKVTSEKNAKTAEELVQDAHFKKLDDAHEGWEEMMATDEFGEYIDGLSARNKKNALRDLKNGTAEDIIEIFTDYKSTLGTDDDNNDDDGKKKKVEAASKIANPKFDKAKNMNRKTKKFLFTKSEIGKMESEEFAKKEEEIDKAMANGQIDMFN